MKDALKRYIWLGIIFRDKNIPSSTSLENNLVPQNELLVSEISSPENEATGGLSLHAKELFCSYHGLHGVV